MRVWVKDTSEEVLYGVDRCGRTGAKTINFGEETVGRVLTRWLMRFWQFRFDS